MISAAESNPAQALATADLLPAVEEALRSIPFIDMHTHLFAPRMGALGLWGIDELLTYHYLEAELFRSSALTPEQYWELTQTEKANAIWKALFVENAPLSEAARGVISVLHAFGLRTDSSNLDEARKFFTAQSLDAHIDHVFQLSGMSEAVMTNDPLDPEEALFWQGDFEPDPRFHPVLRLDRILIGWDKHWPVLESQGYAVNSTLSARTIGEARRFLSGWCERIRPVYLAFSLSDDFQFPEESTLAKLLEHAVLPVCREYDLPLSLMIGVRRQVNPRLRLAGDGAGKADLRALEHLCAGFPENRFLASVLSRENQHELCVYARKFSNLLPFGCWWFLNNPSVVEEVTRERLEMLGSTFIPQHSDARVLEQVIYKWRNTRRTMAPILANAWKLLSEDGRPVTRKQIQRDVRRLFRTNFAQWARIPDERSPTAHSA